jgi:hypothetical protein
MISKQKIMPAGEVVPKIPGTSYRSSDRLEASRDQLDEEKDEV